MKGRSIGLTRAARAFCAALLLVCLLGGASAAQDQATPGPGHIPQGFQLITTTDGGGEAEADSLLPPSYYQSKWSPFWRTTLEMIGFNLIMTLYGRYVMKPEDHGFNVSWETIEENLKNGFEWDDNSFSANNFRHPYQGSLYYGGARANGYDFYQSSMFAFAGSWLFEYTGEAHHPSINDWINTAVGGVALGEALYRMSDMVLDNKATGSGRFWRELGGFAFSPMRGVNRLITGEAYKVHQNPPDRSPNFLQVDLKFGARTLGDQNLWTSRATKPFFAFAFLYGDPFQEIRGDPFDHFRFAMQLNFNNSPHLVGLMETEGLLFASDVNKSATSHHIISSFLHFDYIDNEAYTYGGQSLSASYLSEFKAGEHFHANTILDLQYILLGASKSDYFNLSGREYDYGPGFGFKFGAMFWIDRYEFMSISHQGRWIHSINGNKADHYVTLTRIRLDYRIRGNVGVGAEYMHYVADRRYEDYPDVHAKNPELKLHLSWKIN